MLKSFAFGALTALAIGVYAIVVFNTAEQRPLRQPSVETEVTTVKTGINQDVKNTGATIEIQDGYRYINANGLPDHDTGTFPNQHNPNTISPQRYEFRVPLHPSPAAQVTPLNLGIFGVALNGVVFDPGAAEFWNNDSNSGWQYEAMSGAVPLGLDQHHAHVQPTGAYHYHALPDVLVSDYQLGEHSPLIGYAADGYPVYAAYGHQNPKDATSPVVKLTSGHQLKSGTRPDGPGREHDGSFVQDYEFVASSSTLDQCNGRTAITPDYPDGTYYYVLTDTYPFIPRCFTGAPDETFAKPGPGPSGPRGPAPGTGQPIGPEAHPHGNARSFPPYHQGGPPPRR